MYRFRSINSVLGEYKELENQEIFLQSLNRLNDPMEGEMDINFKGDEVVWRNLLNHYIKCLEDTVYSSLYLQENDEEIKLLANIQILKREYTDIEKQIMTKVDNDMIEEQEEMLLQIKKRFFSNEFILGLAGKLSKIDRSIHKEELLSYLRIIHPFAIEAVNEVFAEYGIMKKINILSDNIINDFISEFEFIYKLSLEQDEKKCEEFFQCLNEREEQIKLLYICNNSQKKIYEKSVLIFDMFPKLYLEQIDKLLYPDWYTACFMTDYTNSSVWGNYGDNHKGVCLIFKTKDNNGKKVITLYDPDGRKQDFQLKKVNYQNKFIEVDFFKSLGALPEWELKKNWFADENGNISRIFGSIKNWNREWKKFHWKSFDNATTTKIEDWKYENEYRIILPDLLGGEFIEDNTRKYKYDFNDLEGIIFGIKTSQTNKIKIMKIIKEKCIKENRKEFNFYQAKYSHITGKIYANKLDILKLL